MSRRARATTPSHQPIRRRAPAFRQIVLSGVMSPTLGLVAPKVTFVHPSKYPGGKPGSSGGHPASSSGGVNSPRSPLLTPQG